MLFNSKKGIYTTRRSELNGKCNEQAKLLVIVDGEIRHLKNFSKLLYSLNTTNKRAYHFCMNYLNGFHPESARENIMSTAVAMVKIPYEKEKWPMFHNGQYQFKVPFTLDRDFESILKSVDEKYRDKMNRYRLREKVRHHLQKR